MSATSLRLLILFVCVAGSLVILQGAFDHSDHQKAERAVRNYQLGGRSFGPFVESRAPGGMWSTEITHSCRGVVRATYDTPSARYQFDYDVPGHAIHPANELGRAALEAFAALAAAPAAADGGAARD